MHKNMLALILIGLYLLFVGCELFEKDEITYDYPTITKIKINKIPELNDEGYAWDEFSPPDIYCIVIDDQENIYYTSITQQNVSNSELPITFKPEKLELKDSERELYVRVYDEDLTSEDIIDTVGPFSAQMIMDDSSNVYTMENYTWTLEVSVTLKW